MYSLVSNEIVYYRNDGLFQIGYELRPVPKFRDREYEYTNYESVRIAYQKSLNPKLLTIQASKTQPTIAQGLGCEARMVLGFSFGFE